MFSSKYYKSWQICVHEKVQGTISICFFFSLSPIAKYQKKKKKVKMFHQESLNDIENDSLCQHKVLS